MKLVSHVHNRPTINVFCAVNSNSVTNLYSSLQRSCQHTLYTVLSAGNTGCSDSWACKQCYSCLRTTQPGSLHMVHRTHLVKPPDVGSHNVHSTWSRETSVHQSVGDYLYDICVFWTIVKIIMIIITWYFTQSVLQCFFGLINPFTGSASDISWLKGAHIHKHLQIKYFLVFW